MYHTSLRVLVWLSGSQCLKQNCLNIDYFNEMCQRTLAILKLSYINFIWFILNWFQ